MAADYELQAVIAEVSTLGKLYGVPVVDNFGTLIDVVTHILMCAVKHHVTNMRAYPEAQIVLPYAPWVVACAWPGKAAVTEDFIVQNCYQNLDLTVRSVKTAVNFNRTFPVQDSQRYTAFTRKVGLLSDNARDKLYKTILAIDSSIDDREDGNTVLPYYYARSTWMPDSTYV